MDLFFSTYQNKCKHATYVTLTSQTWPSVDIFEIAHKNLHHRCRGYDMRQIIRMFHRDPEINDGMVNRFVNDAYDANFETIDLDYLTEQIARPFVESLK